MAQGLFHHQFNGPQGARYGPHIPEPMDLNKVLARLEEIEVGYLGFSRCFSDDRVAALPQLHRVTLCLPPLCSTLQVIGVVEPNCRRSFFVPLTPALLMDNNPPG